MKQTDRGKFKHGTHLGGDTKNGRYIRISSGPQRNVYVHRLVLEAKLGRKLRKDENAHHLDHNTLNNAPENLQAVHQREHHHWRRARK